MVKSSQGWQGGIEETHQIGACERGHADIKCVRTIIARIGEPNERLRYVGAHMRRVYKPRFVCAKVLFFTVRTLLVLPHTSKSGFRDIKP